MALPEPIDLDAEEAGYIVRVLQHHADCKDLCDEVLYNTGETCREYRSRIKRIWGNPDGILRPEAPDPASRKQP